MPVATCGNPGCGFTKQVPESYANRRVKCPRCGHAITIADNTPQVAQSPTGTPAGAPREARAAAKPAASSARPLGNRAAHLAADGDSARGVSGLAMTRSSLPVCLLVLFFMPWGLLSCAGQEVGTMSGLQMMQGKFSLTGEFKELAEQKGENTVFEDDRLEGDSLLGVYLLGLGITLVASALALFSGRFATLHLAGSTIMLGLLLMYCFSDFHIKQQFDSKVDSDLEQHRDNPQPPPTDGDPPGFLGKMPDDATIAHMSKNMFQAQKAWGFVASAALAGLLLVLSAVELAFAAAGNRRTMPPGAHRRTRPQTPQIKSPSGFHPTRQRSLPTRRR